MQLVDLLFFCVNARFISLQVGDYKDAEQQARKSHIGIWKYGDMWALNLRFSKWRNINEFLFHSSEDNAVEFG